MKFRVLGSLLAFGFCAALAVGPARAQSHPTLAVDIPFAFTVGKTKFAAGKYTVKINAHVRQGLTIRSDDDASAVSMALSMPVTSRKAPNESHLVFNRYRERYFLSSVWVKGYDTGHELFKSRLERQIRKRLSGPHSAQSDPPFHTVTLVAQQR